MNLLHIIVLAIVQGIAELLPVSSSAHVIMAEKWLGLDPTTPEMTFLLVMLHTGTMFAVIGYFWSVWRQRYFASMSTFVSQARLIVLATAATGVIGLTLKYFIERVVMHGTPGAEIEDLFGNHYLMAASLFSVGLLIIYTGLRARRDANTPLGTGQSLLIGAVQGLCLPFRGFSRSGATISAGMLSGVERLRAEEFSFALAVVLTPPVVAREAWRLYQAEMALPGGGRELLTMLTPGLLGMVFSFLAGWLALRWLSRWLEQGRWHWFGFYCLAASAMVMWVG